MNKLTDTKRWKKFVQDLTNSYVAELELQRSSNYDSRLSKSGCYAIVSYGFPLLLPFRLSASGWRMRKVYETIQWTVNAIPGHHHSHSLSLSHFRLSFVISLFARWFLLSLGRTRRKRRKLTIKVSCHISVPNAHNKVFRERILNATLII